MFDSHVHLIDEVLSAQRLFPIHFQRRASPEDWGNLTGWFKSLLKEAVVFDVSNVAEYYFAGTDKEEWFIDKDFPCLAPPYPCFWMEYSRPSRVVSEVHGVRDSAGLPEKVGALFGVTEIKDFQDFRAKVGEALANPEWRKHFSQTVDGALQAVGSSLWQKVDAYLREHSLDSLHGIPPQLLQKTLGLTDVESSAIQIAMMSRIIDRQPDPASYIAAAFESKLPRWVLQVAVVMKMPHGIVGPGMTFAFQLDERGARSTKSHQAGCFLATPDYFQAIGEMVPHATVMIHPFLMALTFLSCKNVTVEDHDPPPTLSEKRRRRHGVPLMKHKILRVQVMTDLIRHARLGGDDTAANNPLHICRGHFKDYRDGGLFGRHKGVYWWDNHLRGKRENGEVVKRYAVN